MPVDFPADTASSKQITPEVTWAQRSSSSDAAKNYVSLTISVPDVPTKDMKLDLTSTGLTFTGRSESKKATYHVEMEFFAEIDPKESKTNHSARDVELKLQKKDLKEEYWPRLLKNAQKQHYLKTDFDKWVDEDEQEGAPDDDYMNQFGGGAGGMPDMGAEGGFGGLDFSKLGGGAGGMPDMEALKNMGGMGGMGGMSGMGEEDEEGSDDEDDEEMPGLEGEENAAPAGSAASKTSGSTKIEEVE